MPPIAGGRPSGLKQPTKTSKDQRPPLPQIKSNKSSTTSAGDHETKNNSLPKQLKGMSPHTSFNLISMNSQPDSNEQSTGRLSYRSGHGGELEKKKEQFLKVKEYAQAVKEQFKPKVN